MKIEKDRCDYSLSPNQLDGLSRREDRDALVLSAQIEQMLIPGNDQLGASRQGTGKHVIIVGIIGHYARHGGRLYHDGVSDQPHPSPFVPRARRLLLR